VGVRLALAASTLSTGAGDHAAFVKKQQRRGRGEGTIFERYRTDASGRRVLWYVGKISAGRNASGRRQRLELWRRSKSELLDALRELQRDPTARGKAKAAPASVAAYLERWLEEVVKPKPTSRRRASTYLRYESLLNKHVIPRVRDIALADFGPDDVLALYTAIGKPSKGVPGGGSPSTVYKAHRILRRAFQPAIRKGLIEHNPVDLLHEDELPRYKPVERPVWNQEQLLRFLKAIDGNDLEALYVLALFAHIREGELFALQTDEIDLERRILFVRHTMTDDFGHRTKVGETKTEESRSAIVLPKVAIEPLRAHLKRRMRNKRLASNFVFVGGRGKPLRRQNFLIRNYYPLVESAKLPRIHFHDLRHSVLSLLGAHGVEPRVLQRRARHARMTTTEEIYVHLDASVQQIAADVLDRLFSPARRASR
jgi:integrase